ncbi:Uncharacterized protein APZ42_020140 [Daphnia magna]|uniref:Uncharacterized protein n=1 Tax=Daphnia magna TaxID=35525 RepID=A0A164Y0M9_9CRUS|nr:Uncharacterized protein APZ42_020140 [Daphnia magna]
MQIRVQVQLVIPQMGFLVQQFGQPEKIRWSGCVFLFVEFDIVASNWLNVGRSFGSVFQQLLKISPKKLGALSGFSILYPCWIVLMSK